MVLIGKASCLWDLLRLSPFFFLFFTELLDTLESLLRITLLVSVYMVPAAAVGT